VQNGKLSFFGIAMAGRPRLPDQLKLLRGTAQPSRCQRPGASFPLVEEPPEPPEWLPNGPAVAEFKRLATLLHGMGLLTAASVSALGILASLHGKIVQQWAAGTTPNGHAMAQLRGFYRDFGLTPASSLKIRAPEPEGANRFTQPNSREPS
jgi:phage terminase small subunit